MGLLLGYFSGKTQKEMLADKLKAKGINGPLSKQSMGSHGRWVKFKIRCAVMRLLYLRYRLNPPNMTQVQANQQILKLFEFETAKLDSVQSTVRKETHSPVLDRSIFKS